MRLLHPFMPFVTEELWSRLPGDRGYVMRAEWPELLDRFVDPGAEEEFQRVMAIVEEVRGHRQAAGAPPRGGHLHLEGISGPVAGLAARLGQVELVQEMEGGVPLAIAPGRVSFPAGSGDARRQKERQRLGGGLGQRGAQAAEPGLPGKAPPGGRGELER